MCVPASLVCLPRGEPACLVTDSFVPPSVEPLMFLLSEEVWLPLSEAGFVPPAFTSVELGGEGNAAEESVPGLGGPLPTGTRMIPAWGTGSSTGASDKCAVFALSLNNLFSALTLYL